MYSTRHSSSLSALRPSLSSTLSPRPHHRANTQLKLPPLVSTPSNSNINKKDVNNIFTYTVVDRKEEENNGIVKLTSYQGHRTTRWDVLCQDISRPNLEEENFWRTSKINALLQTFIAGKEDMVSLRFKGKDKTELEEKMLNLGESILSLYSISLNIMSTPAADSLVDFGPVRSRAEAVRGLMGLIPELCRFPYSFYKKIDFISITFFGSMVILKHNTAKFVEKKLMNGIFPLGSLVNDEKIAKYFYRMLIFHLKAVVEDFDAKLNRINVYTRSRTHLMNSTNFIVSEQIKKKKDGVNLEDQISLLRGLIVSPKTVLNLKDDNTWSFKVDKMKLILETVDPDGINPKFWTQLGYRTANGSLAAIEEI